MSFCKYHPLEPATFYCSHCERQTCDYCSNEGEVRDEVRCFLCEQALDHLGAANQAEPFWRRFDKSFRYPLNAQSLTVIVVLSALSSIALYLPFAIVWYCAAMGALMRYSFSCLQATAQGDMTAPDISASYGDGLGLVLRLLVIMIALGAAVFALFSFLGVAIGGIAGVLAIAALPAIIIMFAMTDSVLEAINPMNIGRLISSIGLPYGLLLAIILVMFGSMEFVSTLIGGSFSFISMTLNAVVSNYYGIVIFHIMGYMLFQYQGELGYVAREEGEGSPLQRDDQHWVLAKAQILIKEGLYGDAIALFELALKKVPDSDVLHSQYFELLLATSGEHQVDNTQRLERFASNYFRYLEKSQQAHKLVAGFSRLLGILPGFKPDSAALRFQLARSLRNSGNPRGALKMLNGLHKQFPDAEELVPAYTLMAETMDELPGMATQAQKCRALIARLEERRQGAGSLS